MYTSDIVVKKYMSMKIIFIKTMVQKHLNCTLCEGNSFEMKIGMYCSKAFYCPILKGNVHFHSFTVFVSGHAFLFQFSYTELAINISYNV